MEQHGYLGLNLNELADKIEYSKATIYNHYESKEDLILAVATMHLEKRADLFGRALTFSGETRERMFVIGFADTLLSKMFPHAFTIHQVVSSPSIWDKASEEQQRLFREAAHRCMSIASEVIRQARVAGDLPEGSPSDQHILAGLVGLAKGSHLLAEGPSLFPDEMEVEPLALLFDNFGLFLDGVGWKPLRTEWDYETTQRRIAEELFANETNQITPA
ncbi:MAG: TetR/AcrR family transcriptional regulator [Verrucomicrobiota bacterium]